MQRQCIVHFIYRGVPYHRYKGPPYEGLGPTGEETGDPATRLPDKLLMASANQGISGPGPYQEGTPTGQGLVISGKRKATPACFVGTKERKKERTLLHDYGMGRFEIFRMRARLFLEWKCKKKKKKVLRFYCSRSKQPQHRGYIVPKEREPESQSHFPSLPTPRVI